MLLAPHEGLWDGEPISFLHRVNNSLLNHRLLCLLHLKNVILRVKLHLLFSEGAKAFWWLLFYGLTIQTRLALRYKVWHLLLDNAAKPVPDDDYGLFCPIFLLNLLLFVLLKFLNSLQFDHRFEFFEVSIWVISHYSCIFFGLLLLLLSLSLFLQLSLVTSLEERQARGQLFPSWLRKLQIQVSLNVTFGVFHLILQEIVNFGVCERIR